MAGMMEAQPPLVIPKAVAFLSSLLQRVAESNDSLSPTTPASSSSNSLQRISVFHGLMRPSISIRSYLERIFRYANCSPSCYVVAYVYLDRFAQRQQTILIDSYNIHRLLITSVMIAAKFMDDLYYNNAYYAKVGGISTTEMNCLELDFLFGIGFQLNVTPSTFHNYCSYLQREMLQFELSNINAYNFINNNNTAAAADLISKALKVQGYYDHDQYPSPTSPFSKSASSLVDVVEDHETDSSIDAGVAKNQEQQFVVCCTNATV